MQSPWAFTSTRYMESMATKPSYIAWCMCCEQKQTGLYRWKEKSMDFCGDWTCDLQHGICWCSTIWAKKPINNVMHVFLLQSPWAFTSKSLCLWRLMHAWRLCSHALDPDRTTSVLTWSYIHSCAVTISSILTRPGPNIPLILPIIQDLNFILQFLPHYSRESYLLFLKKLTKN